MPQNNVLPDWRATYPNDAPVQKPGGVTVSTTATAPRVPNKFVYAAGTIQSVDFDTGQMVFDKIVDRIQERVQEAREDEAGSETEPPEEELPEDDDNDDKSRSVPKGKRRR